MVIAVADSMSLSSNTEIVRLGYFADPGCKLAQWYVDYAREGYPWIRLDANVEDHDVSSSSGFKPSKSTTGMM